MVVAVVDSDDCLVDDDGTVDDDGDAAADKSVGVMIGAEVEEDVVMVAAGKRGHEDADGRSAEIDEAVARAASRSPRVIMFVSR